MSIARSAARRRTALPRQISMMEFRKHVGEYLIDVRRNGDTLVLTKSGKPVAMIVPFEDGAAHGARR